MAREEISLVSRLLSSLLDHRRDCLAAERNFVHRVAIAGVLAEDRPLLGLLLHLKLALKGVADKDPTLTKRLTAEVSGLPLLVEVIIPLSMGRWGPFLCRGAV
mgnify:CR=1 FL=1